MPDNEDRYEHSIHVASFRASFMHHYRKHEAQQRLYLNNVRIRSRAQRLSSVSGTAHRVTGEYRMATLNRVLDSFVDVGNKKLTRHKFQVHAHKQFQRAILPLLLKDDLDKMLERVLRENKWSDIKQQVLCVWPRRYGKTFSVAMFVVATAMSVEAIEQSIFSTGRRASKKLLELILKFLTMVIHLDPTLKIEQCNQETIWIRGPHGLNDVRKISSYPSKVNIRNVTLFYISFCVAYLYHLSILLSYY